jgi:HK97 family phage major capsid protein
MATYAEQISAYEAKRASNVASMNSIMAKSAEKGETLDASQQEEFDGFEKDNSAIDDHLKRLQVMERANVATAKPIDGATGKAASDSRTPGPIVKVMGSQVPKGVGFVRLLSARFMAKEDGVSPADIALSKGWGDDIANVLRVPKHILKTAVNPATTLDSTWAAPLVTYTTMADEFIELLRARSILDRIPGLRKVPFNIKVPRETSEMTGYWVPQGSPKPLTSGAFDTVTVDFAKAAGITYQTQELLRFSRPNSEQLLVNSLTKAIIKLVDNDFLDPSKAAVSGESPASITNGVTPIAASGTTAAAFMADFADLLAAYSMANYNLDDLVVVMSQTQALRLGLMRNDFGGKEFPDINKDGGFIEGVPVVTSENIAANGGSPADGRIIVALSASSILVADDGGVDIDISTEASVQAETAPDSPSTASTVMISFWQRNLVGIRCERFVSWTKGRTGAAQYISGANYG